MSDEISKTERRLTNRDGDNPDLRGVIGGDRDAEDVEVYGYQVIYTTGTALTVPRDELLDKMDEVGLPEWMAPGRVGAHRAFGRAVSDLSDSDRQEVGGQEVEINVHSGSSRYEQHVHASVYHEQAGDGAGKVVDHELGVLMYDSDNGTMSNIDRVDDESPLADLWYSVVLPYAESRFETHQDLHNGKDINNMTYYLVRRWTDAVKLRDSCYFVPAHHEGIEDIIDGFRSLYSWIDREHKDAGQTTELFAVEIIDSERQREMVESKVADDISERVHSMFDDVVSEVRDGVAVEEVAEDLLDEYADVEGRVERQSALLDMEMSVERALSEAVERLDEDRQTAVEKVLDEAGLDAEVSA